jgi:hypothetical protein
VDNIRSDFGKEFGEIGVNMIDTVTHGELLRHEWFRITNGH